MNIYIAGKITGDPNYREKFNRLAMQLVDEGHNVMNPAVLPDGFEYEQYMEICFKMLAACPVVVFMPDWKDSDGAIRERKYSGLNDKIIVDIDYKKIREAYETLTKLDQEK